MDRYNVTTDGITVIDGIEVDITVTDDGAGERMTDHVHTELKTHCGRISESVVNRERPPREVTVSDIDVGRLPLFTVDWAGVLDLEADDD